MPRNNQTPIDELREDFHNRMLDAYEMLKIEHLLDHIQRIEQDRGIIFSDDEIRMVWSVAANEFIDSVTENFRGTPISEFERGAVEQDEKIAAFESQRPQNIRYEYLKKTFASK